MKYVHLTFAILATFRLVELFLLDRVTLRLRQKYPSYLWQCQRCLSVWAGGFATLVFIFMPWLNWPFALSWLLFAYNDWIINRRMSSKGRQLLIEAKSTGQWIVARNELQQQEVVDILSQITRMKPQANGNAAN